jgi:HEAT repeat protein
VNSYGLARREVDTSFFKTMTDEEKELAKRLIRDNLKLRQAHLFRAAGELKDQQALPILYEQFNSNTDLSWLLSIGQAIWRINGDRIYLELLRKLQHHPSGNIKAAHFEQVTDFKDEESIEMLLGYLRDPDDLVRRLALSKLNYIATGNYAFENCFNRKHFLKRRKDETFKSELLHNLQNLR